MIGPLILLAATVSPPTRPIAPASEGVAKFQPSSAVTVRATASVRIVSGVRFGSGETGKAPGAVRRKVQLSDAGGPAYPVELLEFQ